MASEIEPSQQTDSETLDARIAPEKSAVKALPMTVPENSLQQIAEKKRIKKGILASSGERRLFEKILYLPYLDFSYRYSAEKGIFSKQITEGQGRSVVLALREVNFGFYPELTSMTRQLVDFTPEPGSIVEGVDSTVLVSERLEELKGVLSSYDNQLQILADQFNSLAKADPLRQDIRDNIHHLKKTRETRWSMFADGLKLPSKLDLEKLELLEGNLFYMPYFMVRFWRGGESRFLVWDREGKENESIADELAKNGRFRDLVQSHMPTQSGSSSTLS